MTQEGYHVSVLQRVYDFRDEIAIFLEDGNQQEAEQFRDHQFVMKLSHIL